VYTVVTGEHTDCCTARWTNAQSRDVEPPARQQSSTAWWTQPSRWSAPRNWSQGIVI